MTACRRFLGGHGPRNFQELTNLKSYPRFKWYTFSSSNFENAEQTVEQTVKSIFDLENHLLSYPEM